MKKTILASIFAGLFTLGAFAANAGDASNHSQQMIKIEHNADANHPTVINIETDGQKQVFEFTQEELNDMDAVEASLADVDEKTRTALLNTLSNISSGEGHMMLKHGFSSADGKDQKFMVIRHRDSSGESDSEHHQVLEIGEGEHRVFKVKLGEEGEEGLHHDTGHAVKIIEKLIEHSVMTPEQLDAIQSLIDSKR
ncbi:MAG: hypothetical protein ACI8WB_003916 [Phenylobacterium sp.]|jgi:hypothetical protein